LGRLKGVAAVKPAAPVAHETVAPVAREPVAPVAREPIAPVARESVARLPLLLAAEPVTPVARVPVAPVASVPVAPVARVPVAPVPDPESDRARTASPTGSRLLATAVTDPSFESAVASALVAELFDFAAARRLDYATALVAESASASPPSVAGECALGLPSSTAFLRGSLHEEIWLRRPPGFSEPFPAGTQWSLRWPVYGLRQAPREWHDTLRTTLATLGFAPATADPSLFLRTDTSLPPFYVLVYVDDLVFATADTEALTLVNSELQKRHTCTDLGELHSYLGLQITRDRAQRTITLTQSHMVHQVLQRFAFQLSSPQPTPLSTSHLLSAKSSDESVEPSGPYPELVGCLMYLMTCTRPDLAYPLSLLARYMAPGRHRKVHWDVAKRVLPGAMAAQELRWLTSLLTDLGEAPRSPPVLSVANTADVFTKALPPGDHLRFVIVLGLLALLFLTDLRDGGLDGVTPATHMPLPWLPHTLTPSPQRQLQQWERKEEEGKGITDTHPPIPATSIPSPPRLHAQQEEEGGGGGGGVAGKKPPHVHRGVAHREGQGRLHRGQARVGRGAVAGARGGSAVAQGTAAGARGGSAAAQATVTGARGGSAAAQGTVAGAKGGSAAAQGTVAGARGGSAAAQGTVAGARGGSAADQGTVARLGAHDGQAGRQAGKQTPRARGARRAENRRAPRAHGGQKIATRPRRAAGRHVAEAKWWAR
ncbi:unnamed protein product, partial [Closterium sp. NIES-53]